jgi:molybdate transport system permease protein
VSFSAPSVRRSRAEIPVRVLALAGIVLLVLLLALPCLGLLVRASPRQLFASLADPLVRDALRLSLLTSLASTALVALAGLPAAYVLATRAFPGKRALELLVDLPMVLPPTVAGFALLMAFGRMGLAGRPLAALGITLPFTTLGVIVAQAFMAAPFFIGPARAAFAGIDPRLVDVAATLRAGEWARFRRVILPLAAPSLRAGLALAGARALGEFGATITFAGNLPGTTRTMPLAVYVAMQGDLDAAVVLSVLLLVMALALLAGLRATGYSRSEGWLRAARSASPPAG